MNIAGEQHCLFWPSSSFGPQYQTQSLVKSRNEMFEYLGNIKCYKIIEYFFKLRNWEIELKYKRNVAMLGKKSKGKENEEEKEEHLAQSF